MPFKILISTAFLFSLSAFADPNCVDSKAPRKPAEVGLSVTTDFNWTGKISKIYPDGKVKVQYMIMSEVVPYAKANHAVDCLDGLYFASSVYYRDPDDGTISYLGKVESLYDTGMVEASLPGLKFSHQTLAHVADLAIPRLADPEMKIMAGRVGTYHGKDVEIAVIFVGGTALVKYDCGWRSCKTQEVPIKDIVAKPLERL